MFIRSLPRSSSSRSKIFGGRRKPGCSISSVDIDNLAVTLSFEKVHGTDFVLKGNGERSVCCKALLGRMIFLMYLLEITCDCLRAESKM